jgi:formate hydrogenlyase subunit 6/NADH:ubiquinone oxidoreductase subunit I
MKGTHNSYFGNIAEGFHSLLAGMKLTLRHFIDARKSRKNIGVQDDNYFAQDKGIVTLQYPYESLPIPDNGRYRLHNEIDDCIVCDLCAKICPVNCIEIEAIKSTEEIGKTSDGSTKRLYAAKFDIDMAKCCYCGLCTTVCPTECLTMTKTYDYSEFDIRNMVYHFTELSPEEAENKKKEFELKQKEKVAAKIEIDKNKGNTEDIALKGKPVEGEVKKPAFKPVFKPVIKPSASNKKEEDKPPVSKKEEGDKTSAPKKEEGDKASDNPEDDKPGKE